MKKRIHHYFVPLEQNDHRPFILRPHFLSFFSVVIILAKVFVTATLFFSYNSPTAFAEITSRRIIELTNQSRQEASISTLSENSLLSKAAFQKAQDMLERDYFDHEDPDGRLPWYWLKNNDYLYSYAGENLAVDFVKAEDVHKAWMKSETHRANILNPNYQEIGIAVVQGELEGKKTTLLVQFFGTTFAAREGEISEFYPAPEIGTPTSTELLGENSQPQLKGEETVVTLKTVPEKSLLSQLIFYTNKFYWIILIFLAVALLINILVRIKVQHKPVIVQTIFVLVLIAIMISVQTHFLENLPFNLMII